ncbi:hypothetical protein [Sporolactobacillus terrae]|uniref:hypothetical protein n=1 Tax=Sporolactobacillus terrae TaxID=269673 RepID=UPI001CBAAC22|nr:hypothetical protein [Sporolactobacillus terrae]UAK17560.1 hypothetical protein K7399_06435 [Sporolactobacillus terrae]
MPLYFAKGYLVDHGKIVKPDETITLEKVQAGKLGDKVKAATVADLSKFKLADLQVIAKDGSVAYSGLSKDQLVAKLTGTEAPDEEEQTPEQPVDAEKPKA